MKYERLTNSSLAKSLNDIEYKNIGDKFYIRLAELEDKIENGALVELHYKIGDMVCAKTKWLNRIFYGRLTSIELDRFGFTYLVYDLVNKQYYKCREVFLTEAEAEKRLEELRGKYE